MADSVYKVIELVGTSTESWEKAARTAVERASQSLRDLRVAEIVEPSGDTKCGCHPATCQRNSASGCGTGGSGQRVH